MKTAMCHACKLRSAAPAGAAVAAAAGPASAGLGEPMGGRNRAAWPRGRDRRASARNRAAYWQLWRPSPLRLAIRWSHKLATAVGAPGITGGGPQPDPPSDLESVRNMPQNQPLQSPVGGGGRFRHRIRNLREKMSQSLPLQGPGERA